MNNLGLKYIKNELTPDELIELRSLVQNSSDSEVSSDMKEIWEGYNTLGDTAPLRCKKKVMSRIHKANNLSKGVRFLRYAAISIVAILIPALIASTAYLYQVVQSDSEKLIEISTGANESANITLPDGTKVSLNFDSYLSYYPSSFGKKERNVTLHGEAYFDVKHNKKSKFTITDNDVLVRVIGTKFNLSSRKNSQFVVVDMEQGKVSFSALHGKSQCELIAAQSAAFDRSTGNITVTSHNRHHVAIWRQKELIFKNVPLAELLKIISTTYQTTIEIEDSISTSNDLFTGSVSSSNILEAMKVIEYAYHVKVTISNNQIKITERE